MGEQILEEQSEPSVPDLVGLPVRDVSPQNSELESTETSEQQSQLSGTDSETGSHTQSQTGTGKRWNELLLPSPDGQNAEPNEKAGEVKEPQTEKSASGLKAENRKAQTHGNLFGKLLNLEVALIMLTGLLEAMVTPLSAPSTISPKLLTSLLLLLLVAVLSYFPPLQESFARRFTYILVEIVLVFTSSIFGAYRVFSLLFATIIAKAGLMLPFRGLLVMMAVTASLHLAGSELHPLLFHDDQTEVSPSQDENTAVTPTRIESLPSILEFRFENEIFLLASFVLVGLMARTIISEQESKRQVEELAMEVEALATYQERARIAREIHDALGHTLTSLNIQLEVAKKLQDRDVEKSRQALTSAKLLASQSLNDVRQALHMIVPSRAETESFDINEAIPLLVRQVEQNQPITVSLALARVKLSATKSHHVYCIVRECLTNIQRHASATQLGITIKKSDDSTTVEITDDGKGFDPEDAGNGFGLSGMKERVEFIGGTISIQSSPGVGTKIIVTLPT
jgi:signal transduction histidine kinase